MTIVQDVEFLTVAEAAGTLKVSISTIRRWIDQGDLPAYRLGPRRVRLKVSDLARLISPIRLDEHDSTKAQQRGLEQLGRPLDSKEKERALAAIEAVSRLRHAVAAGRGGKLFSPSHAVLNEIRDERTRDLGQ
ncbi:MAG: DNA-binding protein [Chloroflexi bacterium]|nr:DNA-binding protein [Chloroflexota bacterium]